MSVRGKKAFTSKKQGERKEERKKIENIGKEMREIM